ncbi:hypothetical protein CBR_g20320 [Chara braunii]|uniref:Urease accessory protein UreH-like transmembrane domain-containing protein n=1 Tax=Chara braunii TaxID=69332 RepID=A0A388L072_CHABU|nr:hypothetical protein CBR_g20320 [Chara braunii]|eukprot:GBG75695.1 hypothetical protein CBR_g20320 [Chara braunii]
MVAQATMCDIGAQRGLIASPSDSREPVAAVCVVRFGINLEVFASSRSHSREPLFWREELTFAAGRIDIRGPSLGAPSNEAAKRRSMLSVRVAAGCGGAQSLTCHHASPLDQQRRCGASGSPAASHEPAISSSLFCSSRRITAASLSSAPACWAIDGSVLSKNHGPYQNNKHDDKSNYRYYYGHRRLPYQQWQQQQHSCGIELRRKTRTRTWRGVECRLDASLFQMKRGAIGTKAVVRPRPAPAPAPLRLPVRSPLDEWMTNKMGCSFCNNARSVSTAATHGGDDEASLTADQQSVVGERLHVFSGDGADGCGWQAEMKKKVTKLDVRHASDQQRDGNDALGMSSSTSSVVPKMVPPPLLCMLAAGTLVATATLVASKHWVTAVAQIGAWVGTGIVGTRGWMGPGSELGPRALLMSLSLSGGLTSAGGGTGGSVGAIVQEKLRPVVQTAWTGLVAGCLHSLTGPDHLAALAPLTIGRSRGGSALLGALWGGGHGTGQMLLGALFVLFKDQLSHAMPALSRWSSSLVGLTLIAIGAVGLKEAAELRRAVASATGDNVETSAVLEVNDDGKNFGLATYCNGVVFGLQPDALMVILPAMALPSRASAAAFLVTFLLGTILAMSSYTACIGVVSRQLGHRMPWVTERLSVISSTIAIALGVTFVGTNLLQIRAIL